MEKLFGTGTTFLEALFLKALCEKAGLKDKEASFKDLTFAESAAAVNKGADAYVLKPPKMKDVLILLKDRLEKQKAEKKTNEEKVADLIQKRAKEISERKIE